MRGEPRNRLLRIELADQLAAWGIAFQVPSVLGEAIDKHVAPPGMDALRLCRALGDVNKDVPAAP